LCAVWAQLGGRLPTAALALGAACLVRQTNLVWVPFFILWEILRQPPPAATSRWHHAVTTTFNRMRGHVILLGLAAAIFLYAGRFTPGTANSNDLRPNPAAFTFAALLVVTLGLPVWFAHLRPALAGFTAAARRRPAFAALWLTTAAVIVGLVAGTYTNPHGWNRDLWWDGTRFTLLRNWPLVYIEKFPALRVLTGVLVVFATLALAHLCRAQRYGRALALMFPFGAILLGSNYLVDPRYYLTPAALLLLFIVPDRRDFLRLAAWWAFIALIHNPFILTGYSLW
jgi:hypothetical protein